MLNQSGTIRLNFFYRENLDYLTTNSTGAAKLKRTGGGISFRKEFDTLGEIFRNVRKQVQREMLLQSPVRPDSSKPAPSDSSLQKRVEPALMEKKKEPLSATPKPKVD